MQLKKLKVKRVTESSYTKVHDLTVKDAEHYITENGVVSHNTGAIYNASIILEFTKAGLKDGDEEAADAGQAKTGLVVTSKVVKNRFVRPIPIKFHISFYKGMNPYVGLENYVSWETCGIGRGKLIEEIIETPVYEADGVTQKIYRNKPKFDRVKSGEYIYEPDTKGNTFAVKHLGRTVKGAQIFNGEVFTNEVLQAIDKVIGPIFQFPKTVSDQNELDELMDADEDEDVTTTHEKLFNQAETVAEVNQITEEATNEQ